MCEEKQSMEMMRVGGSFWEGGLEAVEKGVRSISQDEEDAEEEEWAEEVVSALETLKTVPVLDGCVQ